eukprot:m.334734 g.334734  ORF g.334734 m.334734 type:complete len:239 (-) comp17422_c0_seq1:84-800(-)
MASSSVVVVVVALCFMSATAAPLNDEPYMVGTSESVPTGYTLMSLEDVKAQEFQDYYNKRPYLKSEGTLPASICCLFKLTDGNYLGIQGTMLTTYTDTGNKYCEYTAPNPVMFGGRDEGTGIYHRMPLPTMNSTVAAALMNVKADETSPFCDASVPGRSTFALYKSSSIATKYVCDAVSNTCVADSQRGLPKEECEQVCGVPLEYHCVNDQCVTTTNKGVTKEQCEAICGQSPFAKTV